MMLENQLLNAAQIVGSNSTVARQADRRLQPEFAFTIRCPNMNMGRFMTLVRVKMKPE